MTGSREPKPDASDATWAGRWLLLAAVLSSCWLMSLSLTAGPLALDEHVSYWVISSDLPGSIASRSLDYSAVPPLTSWIQAGTLTVFGKSEFALRLPSACGFIAAVIATFLCVGRLRGPICAGIAALILAWHPEAMDEARIGRCYGLVVLFSALLLDVTFRWEEQETETRWGVIWGGLALCLVWSHYTAVAFVAVAWCMVAYRVIPQLSRSRAVSVPFVIASILVIIGSVPLISSVLRIVEWGDLLNYSAANVDFSETISPFWWFGLPCAYSLVFFIGSFTNQNNAATNPRGKRCTAKFVFLSLLPILAMGFLASQSQSSLANPRYRVAFAPATAALVAILIASRGRFSISVIGAVILITSSWWVQGNVPWQLGRLGNQADYDWRELNQHISENVSLPVFVQGGLVEGNLVPGYIEDDVFLEYVACRAGKFYLSTPRQRIGLPLLWENGLGVADAYARKISDIAEDSKGFWVAVASDTDLNLRAQTEMHQIATLSGFQLVEEQKWDHAILLRYEFQESTAL